MVPTPVPTPRFAPRSVAIELVRGCNFTCPMCPVTSNAELEPSRYQFIDLGLLESVVTEIDRWPSIQHIWFFHMGEAMLHPQYRTCLELLHRSSVARRANVILHTNASVLKGEKARAMLEVPIISKLVFSFDGFGDRESFERLRGPHYEQVMRNIREFAAAARVERPDLKLATCTILPREGEVPGLATMSKADARAQLESIFGPLGIAVETRDMHDYTGNEHLTLAGLKPRRVLGGCPFVERDALHVTVDGWAQPCCVYSQEFNVGNVRDRGFGELLNGQAMNDLRHALRLDRREDLPFCRNCSVSMSKQMGAATIERIWTLREQQGLLTDAAERDYIFGTVIPQAREVR